MNRWVVACIVIAVIFFSIRTNSTLKSQLQNSSARKIALFDRVESASPRLPFWAGPRQSRPARHCLASQHDQKTSFFRCRGVLQLALKNEKKKRHAVVSGQSITGMIAAIILAKSGYHVDTYEIRDKYSRNIQWAARQSLVDELASIDQELACLFLENVARPLDRGSIHITKDGARREKRHDGLRQGIPAEVPKSGKEMMAHPSVINLEAKVFELFLNAYLRSLPNVHRHLGNIRLKRCGESYSVNNLGTPDLIVLAEGANSNSRSALSIPWISMTQGKVQISGTLGIDSGGVMIKHWRYEGGQFMLTGVMGRKGCGKTWIVADIDPSLAKAQRNIDDEFRRLAAASLELPIEKVNALEIFGPSDGKPIRPFFLQQKIAKVAAIGNNVILMGDTVGTGHWSVGGGMQVGAVCHAERLKTLLHDIESSMSKEEALNKYSSGVISDTLAWGNVGLSDFYP